MTLATSIPSTTHPAGKAGEFDFLSGHWTIKHRQLKSRNPDIWDTFAGEATCWAILDGAVSVEELRIPSRNFSGMGLRMLDKEMQVWSDFWVNARSGAFLAPGVAGGFEDGRGVFVSEETDGDQKNLVRGVWDNITASACRWEQATSHDGGENWDTNWSMEWTRVA